MSGRCVIFGAGEYDKAIPAKTEQDLFIAADAGYLRMREIGLRPDLLIGDFDSLGEARPADIPVIRLPVKKDVTDMDAAAGEGRKRGYTDFALYGCLGGRPDHSLANLSLAARLSQQGCRVRLYGAGFVIAAITDGRIDFPAGKTGAAAVFSWTDKSEGVTIEGMQYPLSGGTLTNTFALGVSNSFTKAPACVSVKRGTLLVMYEST